MNFDSLIESAAGSGASDLHLEAGMPAAVRVRGALRVTGEPVAPGFLTEFARRLIGEDQWAFFVERRSFDLSRTIAGVRCRVNILHTSRGVGMAIRFLGSFQATVEKLNLHPDLKKLVKHQHGLILVSGPTGSGKSSTLAALIQEINLTEAQHIITVESPIEYTFRSRRAFIRQREVGRDTPSFEQALLDSLREDPDVLMVGEMRDPDCMRLTLSASETGHLVLATVHSSTCAEAVQRVASAFPAEIQSAVCAQLADCLVAVVSQRLRFREDLNIRVPECEILMATNPVKNFIRTREFFKIITSIETGADHGMWTYQRYARWLDGRTNFYIPGQSPESADDKVPDDQPVAASLPLSAPVSRPSAAPKQDRPLGGTAPAAAPRPASTGGGDVRRIEIDPDESGFGKILRK
ncbi:MAG TPA: PilT/PilU family type 4a pilus ATPase [Candidatus Sulfotelmatobacter sp.]|nr:PilT/PilU family type 4a pilus ATPase [Candidatus Sulfotelmatobacter sp.]